MSIKFNCTSCQKKLKVDDASAGKKAKCPKCGTLSRIPSPSGESVSKVKSPFDDDSVDRLLGQSAPAPARRLQKSAPAKEARSPIPTAIPVAAMSSGVESLPPMPVSEPTTVPSSESPYTASNPFAPDSAVQANQSELAAVRHAFGPLGSSVFYLKITGWWMIIYGVICAITIFGIIICWLPIWIGISLKNAGEELERGYATGDMRRFQSASKNLSTYFTIMGVLSIIGMVLFALYAVFLIFALLVGGLSAFA